MKLCLVFGSSKTFITPAGGCTPSKLRILKSSVTLFCNNDTGVSVYSQLYVSSQFPPSRPKIVLLLLKTFGPYNQSSGQAATLTNWVPGFFQCWFKIGCSRICQCMGSPISLQGQEGECGKQFHAARKWKYQSQLKWVESVISRAAKLCELVRAKNMHSVIIEKRLPNFMSGSHKDLVVCKIFSSSLRNF